MSCLNAFIPYHQMMPYHCHNHHYWSPYHCHNHHYWSHTYMHLHCLPSYSLPHSWLPRSRKIPQTVSLQILISRKPIISPTNSWYNQTQLQRLIFIYFIQNVRWLVSKWPHQVCLLLLSMSQACGEFPLPVWHPWENGHADSLQESQMCCLVNPCRLLACRSSRKRKAHLLFYIPQPGFINTWILFVMCRGVLKCSES